MNQQSVMTHRDCVQEFWDFSTAAFRDLGEEKAQMLITLAFAKDPAGKVREGLAAFTDNELRDVVFLALGAINQIGYEGAKRRDRERN